MNFTGTKLNYDDIISRQQKRISELKQELAGYETKLNQIYQRASESYQAAVASAFASGKTHCSNYGSSSHVRHIQSQMIMQPLIPQMDKGLFPQANPKGPWWGVIQAENATGITNHRNSLESENSSERGKPPIATCVTAVFGQNWKTEIKDGKSAKTPRYWTKEEHNRFLFASALYGPRNYVQISEYVATRSPKQVRTHSQKFQLKLRRDAKKGLCQSAAAVVSPPKEVVEKNVEGKVERLLIVNPLRNRYESKTCNENASPGLIDWKANQDGMKKSPNHRNLVDTVDVATSFQDGSRNSEEEQSHSIGDNVYLDMDLIDECFREEPFADPFYVSDQ